MKNSLENRQRISRVMEFAEAWLGNNDSAKVCYNDACRIMEPFWGNDSTDDIYYAGQRVLDSLRYSVGMLHEDYKLAVSILKQAE